MAISHLANRSSLESQLSRSSDWLEFSSPYKECANLAAMLAIESSSAQEQCRAPACTNSVTSPALTSMVVPPAAQQDDSIYGRISELFPINRQGHVIDSWLQWQRRNPGCMLVATVPLGRNSLHLLELEQGNNESLEEYIDLAWHMVAASLRKALISLQPSEECANQDAVLRAYQKVVSAMSSVPGADFNFELKLEDKSGANERLSCVQNEDMNVAIGRLFVSAGIASEHDVRLIGHCASINRVTLTEMATILLGISVNLARGIEQISAEVVHGRISFYQGVVAVNHSYLTGSSALESILMVTARDSFLRTDREEHSEVVRMLQAVPSGQTGMGTFSANGG